MSEATNCNHNCSTCSADCSSRKMDKSSFLVKLSEGSSVKKVIGVVSGKGGVGKSLVTSLMACQMRAKGHRVGILDADITGPSIPKAFGIHEMVGVTPDALLEMIVTIVLIYGMLIVRKETGNAWGCILIFFVYWNAL